ncbi:hypothetical protein EYF80_056253 [Liparis tanakae]|uniref:Uncharacterized protein n=1 Tax=Liparis tanakae TaxID=230148 RepID=A0A4Z2EXJ7_9TELE|nr:hypothetical protein EYF80_056253 [Liparis tanakae]
MCWNARPVCLAVHRSQPIERQTGGVRARLTPTASARAVTAQAPMETDTYFISSQGFDMSPAVSEIPLQRRLHPFPPPT